MTDPDAQTASRRRTTIRIAWAVVALAAIAVVLSFLIRPDDDAAAKDQKEAKATPVSVVAAERGTVTERRRYPGELDADAADVASFYPGRVEAVHVRVGDLVAAEQPLVEMDPVDAAEQIARAKAQAQAAGAEARRATVELEAARRQLARYDTYRSEVSDTEYDAQVAKVEALEAAVATAGARGAEARAGQRLLEKRIVESVVRAPFAGRIAARHVDPGVIVTAGAPLVRVVAIAPLRVHFDVPEQDVAAVQPGGVVRVVAEAGGDAATAPTATITGIAAEVDRRRRVATVEAVLQAAPPGWLPGRYAEAIVDRHTVAGATVVPAAAVLSRMQPDGTIATGVLIAGDGVARWVPVAVAAREDDRIAVDGAVAPGDPVLVAGHVDLADGGRIEVSATRDVEAEAR